MLLANLIR